MLWGDSVYDESWVIKLKNACFKKCKFDFDFYCLTDRQYIDDDIKILKIENTHHGTWNKVKLFNEFKSFNSKILYIDLDVIILKDLNILFDCIKFGEILMCSFLTSNHRKEKELDYHNSSFMGWFGNDDNVNWIYDDFIKNSNYYIEKYFDAEDSWLSNGLSFRETFPENIIGSFISGDIPDESCTVYENAVKKNYITGKFDYVAVIFNRHKGRKMSKFVNEYSWIRDNWN